MNFWTKPSRAISLLTVCKVSIRIDHKFLTVNTIMVLLDPNLSSLFAYLRCASAA